MCERGFSRSFGCPPTRLFYYPQPHPAGPKHQIAARLSQSGTICRYQNVGRLASHLELISYKTVFIRSFPALGRRLGPIRSGSALGLDWCYCLSRRALTRKKMDVMDPLLSCASPNARGLRGLLQRRRTRDLFAPHGGDYITLDSPFTNSMYIFIIFGAVPASKFFARASGPFLVVDPSARSTCAGIRLLAGLTPC